MTTEELISAIDSLRDDLMEARRYVRRQPNDTAIATDRFRRKVEILIDHCKFADHDARRWCGNLIFGVDNCRAVPGVLEGYIDGASYELAYLKGLVERGVWAATTPATAGEGGGA